MGTNKVQENTTVVVEIGLETTKAVRLRSVGQTFILLDYWIENTVLATEAGADKIIQPNVGLILSRLDPGTKKITLVINDASTFNLVQKVPVSTEDRIRHHIEQRLQAQKFDLSKYFWTVTPLATGLDDQEGLTEALSNKLPVLVSGTRKENVETLRAAFQKEGCIVEHIFFQIPSLIKAFEFYSEKTLANQIVSLLHFNGAAYGLGIVKNCGLVSFCELKLAAAVKASSHPQIHQEIKTYLSAIETRYRSPARCLFISGDYSGTDLFLKELKEQGFYARTWSVVRKLSIGLDEGKREQLPADGAKLNTVLGAGVAVLQALQRNMTMPSAPPASEFISKLEVLVRPLALAACILIVGMVLLFTSNCLLAERLKRDIVACAQQEKKSSAKQFPLAIVHKQVDELEYFASSRHRWLPVFNELQKINVPGVEVSQIRATDSLVLLKVNGFDQVANGGLKRKTAAALTIEARNEGGLGSLETFIDLIKNNQQIRPLLNKKRPFRLVNNIPLTAELGKKADTTLFTVEYLLEEQLF